MFSSVSKFLDSAVSADMISQAKSAISSSTAIDHIYCRNCQGQITIVTAYGKYTTNNKCRMCCQLFCTNCVTKSKVEIPDHLLNFEFRKPAVVTGSTVAPVVNERQLLCGVCMESAMISCMEIFTQGVSEKFEECFTQFFESSEQQGFFFPIPTTSPEDTTYRKALRLAVIAETIADFSGYSMAYKAVKYAYYSHELVALLMRGGVTAFMLPMLESLKAYGITGPTAILRVYYLGCKHTLAYKVNCNLPRAALYQAGMTGVLLPECPLKILQYIGEYVSPAQWLYVSCLPAPHDNNEWSSWYLSRIIRRQGWTVLQCINDTTQLPNGIKCPAFALVTRKRKLRGGETHSGDDGVWAKEALLVVRGSKSTMDWAINLEESLVDFEYTYKAHYQAVESPGVSNVLTVQGKVHRGIHQGALGILDAFTVRQYLLRLLTRGYKITVVGHSLGAGTAAIIAAEMRSTVSIRGTEYKLRQEGGDVIGTTAKRSAADRMEINYHLAHNISAVVFACPSIVSEPLADAFAIDKLLVNVVVGNDIIPRVSRKSFAHLAREVIDFSATASVWTAADKSDFWRYMENMGKASDIHRKENDEGAASAPSDADTERKSEDATAADAKASSSASTTTSKLLDVTSSAVSGFFKYASSTTAAAPDSNAVEMSSKPAAQVVVASAPPAHDPSVPSAPPAVVVRATPVKPNKPDKPPRVPGTVVATPVDSSSSAGLVPSAVSIDKEALAMACKLQIDDPDEYIVTPGPIVHVFRENNGQVKSAVVTHCHSAFTRMQLIFDENVEDHRMVTYRAMLTSALFTAHKADGAHKRQKTNAGAVSSEPAPHRDPMLVNHIFNMAVVAEDSAESRAYDRGEAECAVDRASVVRKSIANCDYIEGVDDAAVATEVVAVQTSHLQTDAQVKAALRHQESSSTSAAVHSHSVVAAVAADAHGATTVESSSTTDVTARAGAAYTHAWKPCYLCGLDLTWPYMLHSDASRATVSHHCAACGEVVCSACAPAGDQLPGDGYNQYNTLPDFRIALPAQGLFAPQRVCLACYFESLHSTHHGLE